MKTESTVELYRFLNEINYRPKFVGKDLGDGVILVCFRGRGKKDPHIEFPVDRPQRMYYEIVDWNGIGDGEIIPLESDHRIDVMYETLTFDNFKNVAKRINESLHRLYSTPIDGEEDAVNNM